LKNNVCIFTRAHIEDTGEKDVTQRDVDFGEHVQLAPGPLKEYTKHSGWKVLSLW
jgi:hypothetical protein